MSGASVILFVNMMVGGLLSAFFLVLALYDRRLVSARWFAAAYAFGVGYVIAEFILPIVHGGVTMSVLSSASMIAALAMLNIGLAKRYEVKPPILFLGISFVTGMVLFVISVGMERESMARNFVYQTPFFLMQAVGA
ncbi:MAG: GGDEF domain-containing protein, partial [Aliihoeflea sp.]